MFGQRPRAWGMADDLPPFDPATAAPFMLGRGHPGWLGLRYVAHGADWVELALPWREDLLGETGSGVLATGPIVSLMDMASGLAIWTRMGIFQPIATLDLRIDYTRAATPRGAVFGRATCYRTTRSAAASTVAGAGARGAGNDVHVDEGVGQAVGALVVPDALHGRAHDDAAQVEEHAADRLRRLHRLGAVISWLCCALRSLRSRQ